LELQPKLLRILHEEEFERLGSTQTLRVDADVINAETLAFIKGVAVKAAS
jgi:transcriptional regulator with GAF, ATPase, and Fis domain